MERPNRRPRNVAIADHIWDAFDEMARSMGSDRDGLINQALFMFARLNGFLEPAPRARTEVPQVPGPRPAPRAAVTSAAVRDPALTPAAPMPVLPPKPANGVREVDLPTPGPLPVVDAGPEAAKPSEGGGLFLETEFGEQRVGKDRFVIGRGKHCDYVINSTKVSREHAAVIHEGDHWFIEDLGSSNGTWFNKQRIKRRQIEGGDEYLVCSERIRFLFR